jgi:hypothetical protein
MGGEGEMGRRRRRRRRRRVIDVTVPISKECIYYYRKSELRWFKWRRE